MSKQLTDFSKIEPKVKAGVKSVAGSAPGAIVFVWLLGETGLDIPPEIAVGIGSLITGAFSFLISYLKK